MDRQFRVLYFVTYTQYPIGYFFCLTIRIISFTGLEMNFLSDIYTSHSVYIYTQLSVIIYRNRMTMFVVIAKNPKWLAEVQKRSKQWKILNEPNEECTIESL